MMFTQTLTQQMFASQTLMRITGKAVETQLRLSHSLVMAALPAGAGTPVAPKSAPAAKAKGASKKVAPAKKKTAAKISAPAKVAEVKAQPTAQDQTRRRKARKAPSMPPELPGVK